MRKLPILSRAVKNPDGPSRKNLQLLARTLLPCCRNLNLDLVRANLAADEGAYWNRLELGPTARKLGVEAAALHTFNAPEQGGQAGAGICVKWHVQLGFYCLSSHPCPLVGAGKQMIR